MRNIKQGQTTKVIASVILVGLALSPFAAPQTAANPHSEIAASVTNQNGPIRVTINSVSPMLGPPQNHYHVGEQIPINIELTNVSNQPVYSCVSGDVYQDLPRLTKDGRLLPYTSWQNYVMRTVRRDQTCLHEDLPDSVLLRPNEPVVVDSLIVVDDAALPTGAVAWYERLTPGTYELSVQRRFDCCDGPMVESNKISFDVVP
ncbi:MAG TPA: hypothetical protein VKB46_23780 [Pyrinomonadaceae bacterium]|nr:hypothetical protein [Pyrinomonadaceae bacterium]